MDSIDIIRRQWAQECPDLNTLPMGILGRMLRVTKYLEAQISDWLKSHGLLTGEFDVLMTLRRHGEPYRLTPSALLHSMMLTSGAMTNRLDKLEAKGMIVREHSREDRRSVEVLLTSSGLACIDTILDDYVAMQERLLVELSSDDQQTLSALLKQWLLSLDNGER
ncbi:MarR family winged helix-turn-helix transcriptional regulator [Vibrio palustris]|uniref:Putative HTH-type transcriptional regulator/GBAA_1941/BAS1801 n=1 Tax=Vibrio palustris TaxID=1918946 RepID=A0A1R4B5G3_9VIBR|nr:MarR family transcriptional regulator [Vibrio palustris]SJL84155.1 putative HTH-type transcriptional regulator/GBAA_1941/BAS1801 [Vibrio palustris]